MAQHAKQITAQHAERITAHIPDRITAHTPDRITAQHAGRLALASCPLVSLSPCLPVPLSPCPLVSLSVYDHGATPSRVVKTSFGSSRIPRCVCSLKLPPYKLSTIVRVGVGHYGKDTKPPAEN